MTGARLLRSREDRFLLYEAANGLCQLCGQPLGSDWHADHIVPWSVSHRTNVFEMQALCAGCNRRKGARGMRQTEMGFGESFDYDSALEAMRSGQRRGVLTIVQRYLAGEPTTAIVLATRYGKADVIRMVAVGLAFDGHIAFTLVLNPNKVLRRQFMAEKHWKAFRKRYGVTGTIKGKELTKLEYNPLANGEQILSATIQLVEGHLGAICSWIESVRRRTGKGVLVCIDEAHTGSEKNSWGNAAKMLQQAGAHVVLLTATPHREDGRTIPGFNCVVLDEQPLTYHVLRRDAELLKKYIDTYQGTARIVQLVPDVLVTFQEAWLERPSPLCKISRVPFDVDLSQIGGETIEGFDLRLSSLGRSKVRPHLGQIVRDWRVIRDGAQRLVEALGYYHALDRSCAAIVYCGNDTDPEARANEHAEAIKAAINAIAPQLEVVIATSADGDNAGSEKVTAFSERGVGDVLIVKQMAGLGLDAERVKVVLDLSTIRTVSAFIQRIMRAATPFGAIRHATYITVDDVIGRDLFTDFVEDQGGAMRLSDGELISSREVPDEPGDPREESYRVDDVVHADFQDHTGASAAAVEQDKVAAILRQFPELSGLMSWPEVAQRASPLEFHFAAPGTADGVEDTGLEAGIRRTQINAVVREIVNARIRGLAYSQLLYRETIREVWREIYQAAGVAIGLELDKITDLAVLDRVLAEAELRRPVESWHGVPD